MNTEERYVVGLLEALAESHRILLELVVLLKKRPEVLQATPTFRCWKYPRNPHPVLEHFIDVELHSGESLVWALEMSWDQNQWHVLSAIAENRSHGQHDLVTFPPRSSERLEEVIIQLVSASSELRDSVVSFSFSAQRGQP